MEITEPLILSRGPHEAGSGRGCVMNVIAWELGGEITDRPASVSPQLWSVLWHLNDNLALNPVGEWDGEDFAWEVPAEYGSRILDIAHRTVGTADYGRPWGHESARGELARADADLGDLSYEVAQKYAAYLAAAYEDSRPSAKLAKAVRDLADRYIEAVAEYVELWRRVNGVPEPTSYPRVNAVDEALRKMYQKA